MLPSPAWPNVYPLSFFPGPGRSAVSYFTGVADSVVGAGTSAKEQKDEDEDEGSSEANFGPERPPSMEVDEWVEREPEAEEFPAWGDEEKAECEAGRRKEEDKRGKRRVREGRCSQVELERVGLWSTSRARRSSRSASPPRPSPSPHALPARPSFLPAPPVPRPRTRPRPTRSSKRVATSTLGVSPPPARPPSSTRPSQVPRARLSHRWPLSADAGSSSRTLTHDPARPTPSTSPVASRISPPLDQLRAHLAWNGFKPFLQPDKPISQEYSTAYLRTLIRFVLFCSSAEKWSSDPSSSIFRRPHSSDLLEQTTETQPNHGYIRQHCPLGRRPWPLLQPEEQEEWEAIRGILRWLYDAASDFEHVSWLLNEAPLPLVVIVRQLAERALLARRVSSAWSECTTHLLTFSSSALSRFTPRERRARTLFQWLEAGGEVRRSVLFHRDGVLLAVEGGQEPWEWAFEGEDEEKVIRVLESREAAELERRARAAKRRKVR